MTKAIFASDLHGNRYAYERLFAVARAEGIATVILGGDLTPKWPILSFGNRALVPLDPRGFRMDANGYTYDCFLEAIEPFVKKRAAAEKHFTQLGGYLRHTGIGITWKTLREEQRVLRRMIEEFRSELRSDARDFLLRADEWEVVRRMLNSLPSAYLSSLPWDLKRLLFGLRMETLSSEDRTASLRSILAVQAFQAEQLKALSPEAQQLFTLASPEMAETSSADYLHAGELCLAVAQQHLLHVHVEAQRSFESAERPQKTFLDSVLRRYVKRHRRDVPDGRVYLILGNDDLTSCDPIVRRMHEQGLITLLHSTVAELGNGVSIAGYPYVRSSQGKFYAGWEKEEGEIFADLTTLEAMATDPKKTIFVIHTPAQGTALDQSFGGQHFGSTAMRRWLTTSRKHLVLSGHIHEAPFVNGGTWREEVDGTLCMQPGAWHDEGLCAIVFDVENPHDARWISDPTKIMEQE